MTSRYTIVCLTETGLTQHRQLNIQLRRRIGFFKELQKVRVSRPRRRKYQLVKRRKRVQRLTHKRRQPDLTAARRDAKSDMFRGALSPHATQSTQFLSHKTAAPCGLDGINEQHRNPMQARPLPTHDSPIRRTARGPRCPSVGGSL